MEREQLRRYLEKQGIRPPQGEFDNVDHLRYLVEMLQNDKADYPISEEAFKNLHDYMTISAGYIDDKVVDELSKIKDYKPIKVYRGLTFRATDLRHLTWDVPKINEYITMDSSHRHTSWTPDINVARSFSEGNHASCCLGMIIEYVAKPNEILIDTRKLSVKQRLKLYNVTIQEEIILNPGIHKVKIIELDEPNEKLARPCNINPITNWNDITSDYMKNLKNLHEFFIYIASHHDSIDYEDRYSRYVSGEFALVNIKTEAMFIIGDHLRSMCYIPNYGGNVPDIFIQKEHFSRKYGYIEFRNVNDLETFIENYIYLLL